MHTLKLKFFQKIFQFLQDAVLPLVYGIAVYPHVRCRLPLGLALEKQAVYQLPLIIREKRERLM